VVDPAVQAQFEQQVGDGVECALQVVARGAQLGGHAMRQRHGALAPGGQQPGQPGQKQAQGHAHRCDHVVAFFPMAQGKTGRGLHHQRPCAPANLQRSQRLRRGRSTSVAPGGHRSLVGGCPVQAQSIRLGHTVVQSDLDVRVQLTRHSGDDVARPERGRNPADQTGPAHQLRACVCLRGVDRQVHHHPRLCCRRRGVVLQQG